MVLASPWASAANKSQLVNTCVLPGLTKVVFMQNMIANGYEDKRTLQRRIPTAAEYFGAMGIVNKDGAAIYKYMNFNQIDEYVENAKGVTA